MVFLKVIINIFIYIINKKNMNDENKMMLKNIGGVLNFT